MLPIALASQAGCQDSDPIRDQWDSRDLLPSCGSVEMGLTMSLRSEAKKEVRCLRLALDSGLGAELRVTYSTVEGDPITDYYRVTPEATAEIYTDATQDNFGDKRWHYSECKQPQTVLDVNC
jgi:hypothetical protein